MLMKLARFDDESVETDIAICCLQNNAHYVPIMKNQFGILTEDLEIAFVSSGNTSEPIISLKAFVNTYKCVTDIVSTKKQGYLFWKKKFIVPYNSKILDNLFFKRVIEFCIVYKIPVKCIHIMSEFNTSDIIDDYKEIQELIEQNSDFIIEKMNINLEGKSIIFDRVGYVDIISDFKFFETNRDTILSMLKVGFEE